MNISTKQSFTIIFAGLLSLSLASCSSSDGDSSSGDTEKKSTLKSTGITQSFTAFDDGDYQAGVQHAYSRDDSLQVVTDHATNLMWQDDADVKIGTYKFSFTGAQNYCNNTVNLGGYDDWRVPTIDELLNIVDKGQYQPALNPIFQNSADDYAGYDVYYWSSSSMVHKNDFSWTVYIEAGTDHYRPTSETHFVRCVREI